MTLLYNKDKPKLKKSLGQHLLIDETVLYDIKEVVSQLYASETVIEVGAGRGALTEFLIQDYERYHIIEKDDSFVEFLKKTYLEHYTELHHRDVLEFDLRSLNDQNLFVLGNYPYNISTQIMFWILEHRDIVVRSVGMFQKEVARRIASPHGTKEYGVLSVLTQAYYDVKYEFDIAPEAFDPPPKVWSGVMSMTRKESPDIQFHNLKRVVKLAFNQRRKMLRNSLKSIEWRDDSLFMSLVSKRPEQISIQEFCELSKNLK